jgi:CBS-domain-containing membrane protein
MNIASICQRRVVTVDSASSLVVAATLMRDHHVGALVVTTVTPEGPRVAGVVTDRDMVINVLARGLDASGVNIGKLASERVASVNELDGLGDALDTMQASGVRRLLVTDIEERLVGIVSLDDLMAACATQIAGVAKVVRSGLEREVTAATTTAEVARPVLRVPAVGTAGWGNPA